MQIIQDIFRQYDIRGTIGKELNAEVAYRLGQLFSYNAKTVVVGRDNRPSSKDLLYAFIEGLVDCGSCVIELEGISTSPLLYFASFYLKTNGAVMATGSHNPLEHNGFKFMLEQKPFYGAELKNLINNPIIVGAGNHSLINLDAEYIAGLSSRISPGKIVWECNNSAVGRILAKANLPGEHLLLNSELSGKFAHIPPDPCIEKTLEEIKQAILDNSSDFGFAFDGDGDRLVMIKGNGQILTGDQLIYLFSLSLKNQPNKKILIDVKASQILINTLMQEGFEVILAPSGHSLMKARIIQENAIFAGELSGHFIINDSKYYPIDDALYAALRISEYLQGNPMIELPLAPICKEFKIAKSDNLPAQVYKPEGMRKSYQDGFYLIRASNTEDYVLVKYEAINTKTAKIIEEDLKYFLA